MSSMTLDGNLPRSVLTLFDRFRERSMTLPRKAAAITTNALNLDMAFPFHFLIRVPVARNCRITSASTTPGASGLRGGSSSSMAPHYARIAAPSR
jgi:hypothetical protein